MDQKLFEFIWDQSKKNQDKALIEFLVGLDSDIKEIRNDLIGDIDCVYREIGIDKEELINEIKACHNDLQIQLDDIRRQMDDRLHFLERDLREEFGKTEIPVNTEK
jgi:hypothetical protein